MSRSLDRVTCQAATTCFELHLYPSEYVLVHEMMSKSERQSYQEGKEDGEQDLPTLPGPGA
jgi:hypothetical protein